MSKIRLVLWKRTLTRCSGYTSSNGPNWVDYITTTYNKSFIETINLAYGGATVDAALVEAYLPTVLSVKQQVQDEYLPTYASSPSFFPWKTDDTLFAVFIGINDVGNSYAAKNASLQPIIFEEYAGLVDQLYTSGARNFLFLNVPPVNRSPLTVAAGASSQALEAEAIAEWNARVYLLSKNLTHAHRDVTSFVFDTNSLFNRVLDYPCVSPITCPYQNTTDYCVAYENGTPTPTSFNATCGISVDKYFWLNSLHPTFRMQQLLASEIVKQLS